MLRQGQEKVRSLQMTIKDIAKESGYALGTVSRVLNNQPGVSEEARRKVMEVVEKFLNE